MWACGWAHLLAVRPVKPLNGDRAVPLQLVPRSYPQNHHSRQLAPDHLLDLRQTVNLVSPDLLEVPLSEENPDVDR